MVHLVFRKSCLQMIARTAELYTWRLTLTKKTENTCSLPLFVERVLGSGVAIWSHSLVLLASFIQLSSSVEGAQDLEVCWAAEARHLRNHRVKQG